MATKQMTTKQDYTIEVKYCKQLQAYALIRIPSIGGDKSFSVLELLEMRENANSENLKLIRMAIESAFQETIKVEEAIKLLYGQSI